MRYMWYMWKWDIGDTLDMYSHRKRHDVKKCSFPKLEMGILYTSHDARQFPASRKPCGATWRDTYSMLFGFVMRCYAVLFLINYWFDSGVQNPPQTVPKPKPAPDIFLLAAKFLGIAPANCCVIEDTVSGVLAGKAAGMTVWAITNTFKAKALGQAGANQVFETYEDIACFFEKN